MKKAEYERAKKLGRAYYKSHACRKGRCNHVTVTSVMTEGGWKPIDKHICHAGLKSGYLSDEGLCGRVVATIDLVPKLVSNKREVVSYFSWLFNKSPFRSVFMNKSAKSAFDYGIVCRATSEANLLVAGLMATRLATEENEGDRVGLWYKLVNLGCDPSLAFIIVSYSYLLDGSVYSSHGSNHTVFGCTYVGRESALDFINDRPTKGKSFQDAVGYVKVGGLWGRGLVKTTFCSRLERIKPSAYAMKDTAFGKKKFAVNSVDSWCEQAIGLSEEFIK